jgi:hypothetical protein
MAAAFVSGVTALVWSTDLCGTNTCIVDRIEQTADKVAETGKNWKYGRINALKAVLELGGDSTPSATSVPSPAKSSTIQPELPPAPFATVELSSTPTPTIQQKILTISNIKMWTVRQFALRDMFIQVDVINQSDKTKVGNAEVTMDLIGPDGSVYTGTSLTDADGYAIFGLKPIIKTGVYKAQVTGVSLNSYTYKPTKISSQLITH